MVPMYYKLEYAGPGGAGAGAPVGCNPNPETGP